MSLDIVISELKEQGLLTDDDKYAFCKFYDKINVMDTAVAATGLFTFRWSTVDYLLAANENQLKIFNIDKKTGEYMGEHIVLEKDQIDKLVCKKYALINVTKRTKINVRVKEIKLKLDVLVGESFRGVNQSAYKAALVGMLKTHFVR